MLCIQICVFVYAYALNDIVEEKGIKKYTEIKKIK